LKLSNTSLVGQVPNDCVSEYMAAADVLVLPSHSEGMPTVLVEAGMMGLPVIAAKVGGIPELLSERRGILVQPCRSREVSAAIEFALANPRVLESMAAKLKDYVRVNHDIKENARKLRDVYEQVVACSRIRTEAIA